MTVYAFIPACIQSLLEKRSQACPKTQAIISQNITATETPSTPP
jgi:hypothetical protein